MEAEAKKQEELAEFEVRGSCSGRQQLRRHVPNEEAGSCWGSSQQLRGKQQPRGMLSLRRQAAAAQRHAAAEETSNS
jgi:hypothetical protein